MQTCPKQVLGRRRMARGGWVLVRPGWAELGLARVCCGSFGLGLLCLAGPGWAGWAGLAEVIPHLGRGYGRICPALGGLLHCVNFGVYWVGPGRSGPGSLSGGGVGRSP